MPKLRSLVAFLSVVRCTHLHLHVTDHQRFALRFFDAREPSGVLSPLPVPSASGPPRVGLGTLATRAPPSWLWKDGRRASEAGASYGEEDVAKVMRFGDAVGVKVLLEIDVPGRKDSSKRATIRHVTEPPLELRRAQTFQQQQQIIPHDQAAHAAQWRRPLAHARPADGFP